MNLTVAQNLVVKAGIKLVESGLIARTWGNVSCRIDDKYFVITPSGRDYLSLTTADIVLVRIDDCSYNGNIKPSSEKGVHAEVYQHYPNINFVIHTHQDQASVISASALNRIVISPDYTTLGGEVLVAAYALAGTKKLRRNISRALSRSQGQAVIMKNHGALCFGKDYNETFTVAHELEKACRSYVIDHYLKLSGKEVFVEEEMINFALTSLSETGENTPGPITKPYYSSRRTENGFVLYGDTGREITVDASLPEEAAIYDAVYKKYNQINHIICRVTPEISAIARWGINLKPLLDDFAQIAGVIAYNVEYNPEAVTKALKKSSLVFIRGRGALCCGSTHQDAVAVSMIAQKACQAYIGASILGKIKPINPLECLLMRNIYLKSYSKQIQAQSNN